ncbi:hypothetical protein CWM57_21505 [Klebsiella sp. G-Nf4]|nr:hypothetical protein CWM64_21545 [Klebsiella sp. I-Nf8]PJR62347.1 hypothetical protein CWM61_17785 [Klebsiella sp. K-Nf6]PJX68236.1 hypothetical protein CWM57_21505 [Klebsiella sp. G-Nf4]PJX74922.1 hypothetical protein CWM55_13715 [Klebsiella sp. G2-16S-Nf13]PKJ73868.1 hypothetical protein CWM65_21515 [Klebsiella sp. J-Nf11]
MKGAEEVTNVPPSSNIAPFPFLAPILTYLRLFMEMINYCLQLKNKEPNTYAFYTWSTLD